nr:MAG: hemolysin [Bacteriophage sp.]
MDGRVRKLEADSQQMMAGIETLDSRVTAHGRELDALRLSHERDSVILAQIQTVCSETRADVAKLYKRVDSRAQEGSKRWDAIVSTLINGTVAALLAYIVWALGLRPF